MHITEEYAFRKAFEQEHSKTSLTPGEAGTRAMQHDRDFHRRWTHYQQFKTDPGPTLVHTPEAPSYETMLADLTAIAKSKGVPRETVLIERLKAQEGTPAFPTTYAHYRHFQQTDGVADRDAAALAKDAPQIFSTAAATSDPRGVVAYVEELVRTLALTMGLSDDAVMQRLKAKQPGLHAAYVQAKQTVPALPAQAPTSVASLKMARR